MLLLKDRGAGLAGIHDSGWYYKEIHYESLQVAYCQEQVCGVDTLSSGCKEENIIPELLFPL